MPALSDMSAIAGQVEFASLGRFLADGGAIFDRFDTIVEQSIVLDLDRGMDLDEFFRQVADKLSQRVGIDADGLLQLLRERERETSTVLSPMLAVPKLWMP